MTNIQIKGPSLKYIPDFINELFPSRYEEWFKNLPEESKAIYRDLIFSTKWYDLNHGHINGIKTLGKVFFNDDTFKAAYEMGKFGGKKALNGIYKIFIKIPSLDFIVKKVSTIASTYYSNGIKIEVTENSPRALQIRIKGFYVGQELMMPNIAGWMDNLMSIISKKQYKIDFSSTPTNNNIEGTIKISFY